MQFFQDITKGIIKVSLRCCCSFDCYALFRLHALKAAEVTSLHPKSMVDMHQSAAKSPAAHF